MSRLPPPANSTVAKPLVDLVRQTDLHVLVIPSPSGPVVLAVPAFSQVFDVGDRGPPQFGEAPSPPITKTQIDPCR